MRMTSTISHVAIQVLKDLTLVVYQATPSFSSDVTSFALFLS